MVDSKLAKNLVQTAQKQILAALKFRQPRLDEIKKSEDMYLNKTKPALKGRFNIPIPIMAGFVDTLMSKIDDPPKIDFGMTEEADYKRAKKVTAAWEHESSSEIGDWDLKDLDNKKLAIFSGFGVQKYYAESEPEYSSNLDVIDYYDFYCEPQGGADLENHLFCGQLNIFKTKADLLRGVKSNLYDAKQVEAMVNGTEEGERKTMEDEYKNKQNRFEALGLSVETNNYVGQQLFNLTEHYMQYDGKRYYLLFDYRTGHYARIKKLKDIFESELWPFTAWHTHRDRFNFYSKAVVDDIRPIAEAIHIQFNQMIEARQKTIWGQRGFDPNLVKNPSQLAYRPDGLVHIDTKGGKIPMANAVYEFTAPRIPESIELITWTINQLGQQTGITASAQGVSDQDKKVGIYYGDLQQVADRLGLYNKYYRKAWAGLGVRYYYGLLEHMPEKVMVKIIGDKGVEWDELKREDLKPNKGKLFNISITGGNAEAAADEVLKRTKAESLTAVQANPLLMGSVNPKWMLENILKNGGFEDEDIRVAMDVKNEGNQEILSEAAQENQDLLKDKAVKPNKGATTGHIQKHIDFAVDNDLKPEVYARIMKHAQSEVPYAQENMARKVAGIMAGQATGQPGQQPMMPQTEQMPGEESMPVETPNTIQGTAERSQKIAQALMPTQ